VESTNSRNVFSALTFLVDQVLVEVGDFVAEGDVLAVLDTADLHLNLSQQRADLGAANAGNLLALQNNQRTYAEARNNLNAGQNQQVINAENAYNTALANLNTAQRAFDDASADYTNPQNAQIVQAQTNYSLAQIELENARRTHENNQVLFTAGGISRSVLENSESALAAAQNRYNDAEAAVANVSTNLRRNLDNAQNQLNNAQVSYNNAVTALNSARLAANQDLARLLGNVETSRIATNNDAHIHAIERLERQIEDSIIRAPISGTVTAVFAREGAMGNGLLFVVEDTQSLKITTRIREFDAANVSVGMTVEIRTDSTGAEVFDGVISFISPTAIRNAQGEIANFGDVEFAAEIEVLSTDTPLLIGMNTRLSVILDQRSNVFSVPFSAVGFDMFGNAYVFVADIGDYTAEGRARRVPVMVGMETDFFMEIISVQLSAGMVVLNDAANIADGMEVSINP